MKKKTIFNIMLAAMATTFAACDDKADSDYVPGEPAPENCMTVYFDADNTPESVFEEGQTVAKEITLTRKVTAEAAEVPIVYRRVDPQIKVPAAVTFEAGQATAKLVITAEGMEPSRIYNYEISVDSRFADPYADVRGSSVFSGSMVVAKWNTYATNVSMKWTTLGVTNTWTTTMERLGTLERYRIKNFIGSGLDLELIPGGDSSYGKTYKVLDFAKNVEAYDDGTVKGYYLYDAAKGDYPVWKVGDIEVADICLMTYYGSSDYSYISFKERYAVIGVYFTDYTDETYDYYNYVYLQWESESEE